MTLADGIRKHGFRKWYERELLHSHAHLALAFLSMIGLFAAFEAMTRFQTWGDHLVDGIAIVACGVIGLWALRRYLYLLTHAEAVANQADCPACDTYARFKILHAHAEGTVVSVRCSKCAHEWTIES